MRAWLPRASLAGVAAAGTFAFSRRRPALLDRDADPIVIVGGGVMGRAAAWRLALGGQKVVLLDALNPLRGSWGDTRASHMAMEDKALLRMSAASIPEWIQLEKAYMAASPAASDVAARRFYL